MRIGVRLSARAWATARRRSPAARRATSRRRRRSSRRGARWSRSPSARAPPTARRRRDRHRARVHRDRVGAEVEQPPREHVGRTARSSTFSTDGYRSIAMPVIERLRSKMRTDGDAPCLHGDGDELTHRRRSLRGSGARRPSTARSLRLAVGVVGHRRPSCRTHRCPRACRAAARPPPSTPRPGRGRAWCPGRSTWRRPSRGPARRGTGARSTPNPAPARTTPRTARPSRPGPEHRRRHARPSRRRRASGSSPSTSPSSRSPTSSMVLPDAELVGPVVAGDDVVHQLAHGPVLAVATRSSHWLVADAGDRPRASRRAPRACTSGRSTSIARLLSAARRPRRSGEQPARWQAGRPRQHRPSMKIHERRWIALGP